MRSGLDDFAVSREVPHDIIEFNIVDFVGSAGLESLVDKIEFFIVELESLVIEDRSESGGGDEAALALVFILEEWLDQEASKSHNGADSSH